MTYNRAVFADEIEGGLNEWKFDVEKFCLHLLHLRQVRGRRDRIVRVDLVLFVGILKNELNLFRRQFKKSSKQTQMLLSKC